MEVSEGVVVLHDMLREHAPELSGQALKTVLGYAQKKRDNDAQFRIKMDAMDKHYKSLSDERQKDYDSHMATVAFYSDMIKKAMEDKEPDAYVPLIAALEKVTSDPPNFSRGNIRTI